jgi:hypothetical protein
LASPSHKANIEGDHTHFGIAIKEKSSKWKKILHKYFAQNSI